MSGVPGSKRAQRVLTGSRADKERLRLRDLEEALSTPGLRRFMFDLLDRRLRLFSASYTGTNETVYNEGKRGAGIELATELQDRYPQLYKQMLSEALDLKARDQMYTQAAESAATTEED